MLDPVGVDLDPDLGIKFFNEDFQCGFSAVTDQFVAVIVVAEMDAGAFEAAGDLIERFGERFPIAYFGGLGEKAANGNILAIQ